MLSNCQVCGRSGSPIDALCDTCRPVWRAIEAERRGADVLEDGRTRRHAAEDAYERRLAYDESRHAASREAAERARRREDAARAEAERAEQAEREAADLEAHERVVARQRAESEKTRA